MYTVCNYDWYNCVPVSTYVYYKHIHTYLYCCLSCNVSNSSYIILCMTFVFKIQLYMPIYVTRFAKRVFKVHHFKTHFLSPFNSHFIPLTLYQCQKLFSLLLLGLVYELCQTSMGTLVVYNGLC